MIRPVPSKLHVPTHMSIRARAPSQRRSPLHVDLDGCNQGHVVSNADLHPTPVAGHTLLYVAIDEFLLYKQVIDTRLRDPNSHPRPASFQQAFLLSSFNRTTSPNWNPTKPPTFTATKSHTMHLSTLLTLLVATASATSATDCGVKNDKQNPPKQWRLDCTRGNFKNSLLGLCCNSFGCDNGKNPAVFGGSSWDVGTKNGCHCVCTDINQGAQVGG